MKKKVKVLYFSWLVAVLNILDGFMTHYGLANDMIKELNPIMDFLWLKSPLLFLSIKTLLSLVLVGISNAVYKTSKPTFQKVYFFFVVVIFVMYLGVFSLHIIWLTFI